MQNYSPIMLCKLHVKRIKNNNFLNIKTSKSPYTSKPKNKYYKIHMYIYEKKCQKFVDLIWRGSTSNTFIKNFIIILYSINLYKS